VAVNSEPLSGPALRKRPLLDQELPAETLISWCSVIAVVLLGAYGFKYLFDADLSTAAVLLGTGTVVGLNQLWFAYRRQLELYRWVFISAIFCLFFFLAISGIEAGSGVLWLYAYPPLIFYITNFRMATIISFVGLALVFMGTLPFGPFRLQHDYTWNFKLMFMITLSFELLFCWVLDLSRRRTRSKLIQVVQELDFAARHDGLTELDNRREGQHQLELAYERQRLTGQPFSALLVDVDHFKLLNDNHGHDAGDQVLKKLSGILLATCRKTDQVARWGGEEFLVLLPDTTEREAMMMAERIREAVASGEFEYEGKSLKVTLSIGLADSRECSNRNDLLRVADRRLYRAKTHGRNQTVDAAREEALPSPGHPPDQRDTQRED